MIGHHTIPEDSNDSHNQSYSIDPTQSSQFQELLHEKLRQAVRLTLIYPTAMECLKRDLEACLTFCAFPESHWKTIRTTNVIGRMFGEVKRRSHKMAAAFRNEDSCLLMFYAVVRSLKFRRVSMPAQEPGSALLHKT